MYTVHDQLTADMLTAQFLENTGVSFLDSGGSYGRQWQRLQGKTTADFAAAPSCTIDWEYECFSINTWQWLNANLTFDPLMQRRFELVTLGSNEPWLCDAEVFAEKMHDGSNWMADGSEPRTFNSYNGETLLDSTIQGVLFSRDEVLYIALQIHGGCDVRGGYTAPKIYSINDTDYFWDETIEFYCQNDECKDIDGDPWAADLRLTEWVSVDGCGTVDPWEDSQYDKTKGQCPRCGHQLEAEARLSH